MNPFVYGAPVNPDLFIGRRKETTTVLNRLANTKDRGSSAVSGTNRIGKTSFLHYIKYKARTNSWQPSLDQAHFVSLDCSSIPLENDTGLFDETNFWRYVLRSLRRTFSDDKLKIQVEQILESSNVTDTFELSTLFENIGTSDQLVVLLLDEFEYLTGHSSPANPRLLYTLRALLNQPAPRGLALVTASRETLTMLSNRLKWLGSPFYNNFAFIELKPFTEDEINALIDLYLEVTSIEFSLEDRQSVYRVSKGHPEQVQSACSLLFDKKSEEKRHKAIEETFEVSGETNPLDAKEDVNKMREQYVDFELHIAPNGYATARSSEGEATVTILTTVASNIELSMNLIEKHQTNADLLKNFGQELYRLLFPDEIHTHFQQTEAAARAAKAKLRIRLRIEADPLARLPLEFAYRALGGYFIAANPNTVLSRYLNLPLPPNRTRRREGALHLLTIIANPADQTPLDPDEWENIILQTLADPLAAGQIEIQTVKRATFKEIRNALLQQKPDMIQFVGHGIYQDGKGYLALVDEKTGQTWKVDDERFANILLGFDDHLGLVSLATCESAKSDSPQGFLGIAPKIVQRGIPAVVAMQYQVLIKTAEIFLEHFYTSIAARKPVDWAVQWARNAVAIEIGLDNREFATPVLYMRAKDGEIF